MRRITKVIETISIMIGWFVSPLVNISKALESYVRIWASMAILTSMT